MTRGLRRAAILAALALLQIAGAPSRDRALAAARDAAPATGVAYSVSMPEPATHLYAVTVRVSNVPAGREYVDLLLPVWTPGSYLVREFARNVQDFSASANGAAARWETPDKRTWRVWLPRSGPRSVEATYRVYANELSVRTSHLDDTHAYFNGATMFMYVDGAKDAPVRLTVLTPVDWKIATGLERADGPLPTTGAVAAHTFTAPDYDRLVDSPVEAGKIQILSFEALGKPHEIAVWGRGNYEPERLTADVKKIVEAASRAVGRGLPYDRYVFIVHLFPGGGGGLEHLNSTTCESSPFVFQKKETYQDFLGLLSHEYFHLWLVKRIRPVALGPFDYETENYTRMLWLMEGGTDYYADVNLLRAGLLTEDEYYKDMAKQIQSLERTPGRRRMSLEESSFSAWIKYYRQNEHSVNSQVSYYTKGSVVTAMLDLEIRGRTKGAKSFDDVLRFLWDSYAAKGRGVPEDAVEPAVEAVAGSSFREFFDRYVRGTDDIPYDRFLAHAGRRLVAEVPEDETRVTPSRKGAWLGANVADANGRTVVSSVLDGSPAWRAGLNAGDELLALDNARTTAASLADRLADRAPGETVTLTVFRRDELRSFTATLAARPPETYKIEKIVKDAKKKDDKDDKKDEKSP
jgi:predicted metalloprotease with PDZ domain